MKDLKNMKALDDKIKFDKRMSLAFSIMGSIIGAGCIWLSIHVVLGM
jgi:hypothetical protein